MIVGNVNVYDSQCEMSMFTTANAISRYFFFAVTAIMIKLIAERIIILS